MLSQKDLINNSKRSLSKASKRNIGALEIEMVDVARWEEVPSSATSDSLNRDNEDEDNNEAVSEESSRARLMRAMKSAARCLALSDQNILLCAKYCKYNTVMNVAGLNATMRESSKGFNDVHASQITVQPTKVRYKSLEKGRYSSVMYTGLQIETKDECACPLLAPASHGKVWR